MPIKQKDENLGKREEYMEVSKLWWPHILSELPSINSISTYLLFTAHLSTLEIAPQSVSCHDNIPITFEHPEKLKEHDFSDLSSLPWYKDDIAISFWEPESLAVY